MRARLSWVLIGLPVWAIAATPAGTVEDVVSLVRSAMQTQKTDKQTAKALGKLKLTESLDEYPIEELESAGAGPITVAELENLRDLSVKLPAPATPPQFDEPPFPAHDDMVRIMAQVQADALAYTLSLPDFICTQEVRRYQEFLGAWDLRDVLTVKLSYNGQAEDYKLVMINNRPTNRSYRSAGGTISQGEFGSMLAQVFHASAKAAVRWDHWTHLRKRLTQVYSYRIERTNSVYHITVGTGSDESTTVVGLQGLIYVDNERHNIARLTSNAVEIPSDFPVRLGTTLLDYQFTNVGGREFLLPLRAVVLLGTRGLRTKNEVLFSGYRKFSGESTISFGDTETKPEIKH